MKKSVQMSETFLVGGILAAVGGFLDAYTYILRGGVFANAQTGNMVLLGMNAAKGDVREIFYYLASIMAFLMGILIAEYIRHWCPDGMRLHWRQITIGFEIAVLALVIFIPTGEYDMLVNILVSFVCSLQVQSFRKINGQPYATTMCTGNLRSAMEHLCTFGLKKDTGKFYASIQYFGIVGCFILGAVLGVGLIQLFEVRAMAAACAGLTVVFVLMFRRQDV